MELIFIGTIAFTTVVFVLLIFSYLNKAPGKKARERIEQYIVDTTMVAAEQEELDLAASTLSQQQEEEEAKEESEEDAEEAEDNNWLHKSKKKKNKNLKQLLANLGNILTPKGIAVKLSDKLRRADIPLKANEFVAIQFLVIMLSLIFALGICKSPLLALILAAIGIIGPMIFMSIKEKKRLEMFNSQILDTLVMIANGLKAGYSFLQALAMVSKEASDPMARELKQVIKENSLGVNLETSLENLNKRVSSEDWDLVTTVVMIQRQVGGNLAEILEKIGSTIRQRMKIKGDIRTKTAQAKVSGILVGALPLGMAAMIYLINPEFMSRLFTFKRGAFRGWFVVVAGIIWEIFGMIAIMKIVDIEV